MSYKGFGYVVDSCPHSKENLTEASTRLNCSVDENGRNQYVCIPNEDLTAIVEFCYTKSIVALYQAGNCLKTFQDGFLDHISCKNFTKGCPSEPFRSTDLYKYPACSRLRREYRCFVADPLCHSYSNASTVAIDDGAVSIGTILGVVLSFLVLVGILLISFAFWRRWQRRKRHREYGELEFSKLMTDDEVTVLFCFMCSDYGPPDFTNTEWLDMFNKIREEVYDKENPITSAEAQHTLNRLKLREYLWADQARGNLTEDAQDWIVYRISRGVSGTGILFDLSSLITAQRYLRSRRYNKKKGENCVSSDESYFDDILIRRLQMNILTHVTMEDTEICDKVSQILNVPVRILKESEEERTQIQKELKQTGEKIKRRKESHNDHKQNLTWLWRNMANARLDIVRSCIGSYPHLDIYIIDNIAYRKPSTYHIYPPDIRSLLYSLLLVESYSLDVNDQTHNKVIAELRKKYFTEVHFSEEKKITDIPKGIIDINGSIVKFISEDIRHDVMYAFVTECLVEDSDLEFFLTMASRDVISEYCRSWDYQRSDGERCLFVPDIPGGMYDLFIDKLQLDIISHCTVSDWGIHGSISRHLNIPQEILRWNIDARERFVKNSMLGSEKMFRARGMIVGCAGAGKTTLLRKLHGRERTDDNKPTETTVGLEVHEDLFAVENNILIDFCMEKAENPYLENKVISMTDFAGQVAYYACHQVYLSRRAFYIVVIDMSRKLTEVCRLFDTDRHNPTGSLFHSWTYKDYFHFWLQTINTYCNDGITQKDPENTTRKYARANVNFQPVILVASHRDKLDGTLHMPASFYSQLEACLSKEQTLKRLISPYRYFEVECPPNSLTRRQQNLINHVKKCIVKTVQKLPHWGEKVPLKWFELENIINQKKANGEKVLKKQQLKETAILVSIDENDLNDVLCFLHDIGKIIYFHVDQLEETVIIDVQWFVDAFKYIITDEKHFARKDSENTLVNTGKISGQYIEEIWKNIQDNRDDNKHHDFILQSYLNHKYDILQYMDKLGLMTRIETQIGVIEEEEMYYIPSMNRTDLPYDRKDEISRQQKSPMMVYFFKSYLPHFFFFRLVVNCLKKWEVYDIESFFKNAVLYKADDADHYFVIGVSKTSIQLQVFTLEETMDLSEECVKKIRQTVEEYIKEITETFHKGIIYEMGFSCTDIKITEEDEKFFLKEEYIYKPSMRFEEISCPRHHFGQDRHKIDRNKMLMCRLQRKSASSPRDNLKWLSP